MATAALGVWLPTVALAAASPAANRSASGAVSVQEIVVTAERREKKLTDVPVSVGAVTGQTLETLGVTDAAQLAALVPGLSYSEHRTHPGAAPFAEVTLNSYGMSNESPIAFYLDDTHLAPPSSITAQMFDVQRVEVLEGPQGTCSEQPTRDWRPHPGHLNKPTNVFSGEASIQYGSYDEVIANAAVGGPDQRSPGCARPSPMTMTMAGNAAHAQHPPSQDQLMGRTADRRFRCHEPSQANSNCTAGSRTTPRPVTATAASSPWPGRCARSDRSSPTSAGQMARAMPIWRRRLLGLRRPAPSRADPRRRRDAQVFR